MKRLLLPFGVVTLLIILCFLLFSNLEGWFELQLDLHRPSIILYCLISFGLLSADSLLPVPSSIVMFMNGAVLGLVGGFVLSLVAAMSSSFIGYYIGFQLSGVANRFFNTKETETAETLLERYGWLAILMSRGLPILAESVAMVTGNLKYGLRPFFWSNLVGYIPVCAIYALAGHYSFETQSLLIAFAVNLLLASVFWIADRRINKTKYDVSNMS